MILFDLRDGDPQAQTTQIVQPLDLITKLTIAGLAVSVLQLGIELFSFHRLRRKI